MTDIVERLQKDNENLTKAIWAKDAKIERLREALKNFCDSYHPHLQPERCQYCSKSYWAAREALGDYIQNCEEGEGL